MFFYLCNCICHSLILTFTPCCLNHCFSSGTGISPKWNTLAAKAASAFPWVKTSRKCSRLPAPPDAIIGIGNCSDNIASASLANPCFTPS